MSADIQLSPSEYEEAVKVARTVHSEPFGVDVGLLSPALQLLARAFTMAHEDKERMDLLHSLIAKPGEVSLCWGENDERSVDEIDIWAGNVRSGQAFLASGPDLRAAIDDARGRV